MTNMKNDKLKRTQRVQLATLMKQDSKKKQVFHAWGDLNIRLGGAEGGRVVEGSIKQSHRP